MPMRIFRRIILSLVLVGVLVPWSLAQKPGGRKEVEPPDLTAGGARGEGVDWNLGPVGARGWIFSRRGHTQEARQILITQVDEGSPADGVLLVGDVITGVAAKPFDADARRLWAQAIVEAESRQGRGQLRFLRWREGQSEEAVLKLSVLGSYAATAPYGCEKSKKIFEAGCEAIMAKATDARAVRKQNLIPRMLNALALLSSGRSEYREFLRQEARFAAEFSADSFSSWYYGYALIFLAEYVMATGDESVRSGLKRLAMEAAHGQSAVGTWGHKFALPSGNLNGYGCMNQPGLTLCIGMVLAKEAGVKSALLNQAIDRASSFLRWYVDKGAVPYGDHQPFPFHEDNGKCSSAAVLFDLLGDQEATRFFAKMAMAAYSERERGHTGNYFNVVWALPGVARCGTGATGAYWNEQFWSYDLARRHDGSLAYQGSPIGEEENNNYTTWDCTGSYLLGLSLPLKRLRLTGKRAFSIPPLDEAEILDVIAAGSEFPYRNATDPYDQRTEEQLLTGLRSWSPYVRRRSAEALGRRKEDVLPKLLTMIESEGRYGRYGACEALAALGPRADGAAPRLRTLLLDPDPWMQSLACAALPTLSTPVRKSAVSDLLAATVRTHPSDPRRTVQRAASAALFSPYPGSRGPRSILQDSLEGVDRELLYPAIESLLQNEDSVVRGSLARIYGKLSDQDLVRLLPFIVAAILKLAPSNEMFGDGIRLSGLDLLARLHIREGMDLCVSVIEVGRWGSKDRLTRCLSALVKYGSHAQSKLKDLETIRQDILTTSRGKGQEDMLKVLDDALKRIQESTETPTLLGLKEFGKS